MHHLKNILPIETVHEPDQHVPRQIYKLLFNVMSVYLAEITYANASLNIYLRVPHVPDNVWKHI